MSEPRMNPVDKPPPPLPGVGVVQPTAEERASIEAHWAKLRDAQRTIAEFILFIAAHPEAVEWATQSIAGTIEFDTKP